MVVVGASREDFSHYDIFCGKMSSIEIRFFTETMPAPEYNCSEHTPEEWTELYGTPRFVLGIWSIVFATACQLLCVPSIRVFNRERKLTSYKIMFNLALADLGGITCVGSLFGYAMIRGYVFCSDTTLAWLIGYPVVCFWYVSSTNCILLVINRISELTDHAQAFKGWPSTLCLAISIVYANMGMLFTRPVLFNSAIQTLAFDPLIPGHARGSVKGGGRGSVKGGVS
ncbi:hypothetical protein PRIPAC_96733 [Pristionchus pacificus]|uniref:G protein-coupled receptor n=1 Tax=Pristionchus pacificus TaxID=54126 RepID=A0A2A6D364_PRIPA|nr:hypothetical protein PRIPAC_96733 [Pristionchus pacificus]|eukprot:PDM84839.1 G protein-coupled receptor [Pristionchus pacificus]